MKNKNSVAFQDNSGMIENLGYVIWNRKSLQIGNAKQKRKLFDMKR